MKRGPAPSSQMKSSALWGRGGGGGRHTTASGGADALVGAGVLAALVLLVLPLLAAGPAATAGSAHAFMNGKLADAIAADPSAKYNVIITGGKGRTRARWPRPSPRPTSIRTAGSGSLRRDQRHGGADERRSDQGAGEQPYDRGDHLRRAGGGDHLRQAGGDGAVESPAVAGRSSGVELRRLALAEPTIAIVDSGVDATRAADFGARVVAQADLVHTGETNTSGTDGYGHGTFVASIAAGEAAGYKGAAPGANIVSLDVLDDTGAGLKSDVLSAVDWIYEHRAEYDIRVANFSLLVGSDSSFMYDPLDQAVEKLWLSGVVVVTAAGNYASDGQASGVRYAPANDPFVITVGAADINGTAEPETTSTPLVGVRLHAGRLPQAGARRAGPVHERRGADRRDDVHAASGAGGRARVPVDVGHLLRRPRRRGCGGRPARAEPGLDAGRRQGRVDAHGRPDQR